MYDNAPLQVPRAKEVIPDSQKEIGKTRRAEIIYELEPQKDAIAIPMTKRGKLVRKLNPPELIRDYVLKQLGFYEI